MFCTNCGNEIDEEMKFCKYCGASQQGISKKAESITAQVYEYGEQPHSDRQSLGYGRYALIALGLLAIVGGIFANKNYHECDWCGDKYVGAAYFDAWDSDVTMCEDCAKQYYQGLNYTQFKVQ